MITQNFIQTHIDININASVPTHTSPCTCTHTHKLAHTNIHTFMPYRKRQIYFGKRNVVEDIWFVTVRITSIRKLESIKSVLIVTADK